MEAKEKYYGISTLVDVGNDAFKDGKQAGIKEVVEWLNIELFGNPEGYIFNEDPTFSITAFHKRWQARLKKWR